jgi:coenzyme Q-binding protein COQ10
MPSHSESRVVPYTADLMFAIVADVERYPEFVPWCSALRILKRTVDGDVTTLLTETTVGFRTVRERYTSRAVIDPKARAIDVTQVDGLFRKLENHWRFTPMGESCRVEFSINFEFASKLLSAIAGSAFALVVTRMTAAFEDRARKLSKKPL